MMMTMTVDQSCWFVLCTEGVQAGSMIEDCSKHDTEKQHGSSGKSHLPVA